MNKKETGTPGNQKVKDIPLSSLSFIIKIGKRKVSFMKYHYSPS